MTLLALKAGTGSIFCNHGNWFRIGLVVVVFYGRWVLFFFDGLDFLDPSEMSSACEIGAEPDLDHFAKQDFAQKLA